MTIIIPFHLADIGRTRSLLEWIAYLGFPEDARFFLLAPLRAQDPSLLALLPEGSQWITDYMDLETNWTDKPDSDATGPNSMWQQAAKHVKLNELGRWLYLEPDSCPTRRDWYQALVFEDGTHGKPFMGCEVPAYGRQKRRMSGVAIYPQNCSDYAQSAFMARETAFDEAGAEQFLSNAHLTELFAWEWRSPKFESDAHLEKSVPSSCAIFHGCKDGSIYPFLKRRIEGIASPVAPHIAHFMSGLPTKREMTPGEVPHNPDDLMRPVPIQHDCNLNFGNMEVLLKKAEPQAIPVPFAISTLATECQKGGLNKARVVKALMEAGIFEKPVAVKKPKRRRVRA